MGTKIVATGSHLPDRRLTNHDLRQFVDTSDEWIVQRTGIRSRHLLGDNEEPSHMGATAARQALDRAGQGIEDVDLILVATTFPDMICPARRRSSPRSSAQTRSRSSI